MTVYYYTPGWNVNDKTGLGRKKFKPWASPANALVTMDVGCVKEVFDLSSTGIIPAAARKRLMRRVRTCDWDTFDEDAILQHHRCWPEDPDESLVDEADDDEDVDSERGQLGTESDEDEAKIHSEDEEDPDDDDDDEPLENFLIHKRRRT